MVRISSVPQQKGRHGHIDALGGVFVHFMEVMDVPPLEISSAWRVILGSELHDFSVDLLNTPKHTMSLVRASSS
mgnify:CR=1 FL=1